MTNFARFIIQGSASANLGYDVTTDGPLTLQLEGATGAVQTATFQVYSTSDPTSPLATLSAPQLTLNNGSSSGTSVIAATPSSSVTVACAGGFLGSGMSSWKIRALANGGVNPKGKPDPDYIFERIIAHRVNGMRAIVPGERTEYSARGPWDEIVPGTAGAGYKGLASSTSMNASTASGTVTLTVTTNAAYSAFQVGDRIKVWSRGTPTDWVAGTVTGYSGTLLQFVPDRNAGANTTHTDWSIGMAGESGLPSPVTAGWPVAASGSNWVTQAWLRTQAAVTAGVTGALGFLRGVDNDVFVATNRSGTDYSLVSTDTSGNGGGLVLGNLGLAVLKLLAGNKTVALSSSSLSIGGVEATSAADPTADTSLTTRGYEAGCVGTTDAALPAARNVLHSHAESTTLDYGAYGLAYTPVGSIALSSAVKKFGGGSIAVGNNMGNYLYVDMPVGMRPFGCDDLTIECWVYVIGATSNTVQAFLYGNNAAVDQTGFMLAVNSSGYLQFAQADVQVSGSAQVRQWGAIITDGTLFTSRVGYGTWAHLAAVRYNGVWCLYVNGVSVGTPVQRGAYPSLTFTRFHVGIHPTLSGTVNGYVDEWRVRREAVYTAAFTAPTSAFADRTSIATAKRKGEIRWYNGVPYVCTDSTNGLWVPVGLAA